MKVAGNRTILVCLSERHIGRLLEMNLRRQGHGVTVVATADEALKVIGEYAFDLAFVDEASGGARLGEELNKRVDSSAFNFVVLKD